MAFTEHASKGYVDVEVGKCATKAALAEEAAARAGVANLLRNHGADGERHITAAERLRWNEAARKTDATSLLDGIEVKTNTLNGMREAIKKIAEKMGAASVRGLCAALGVWGLAAHGAEVVTAKLADLDLDLDAQVVTNVTFDGLATTGEVARVASDAALGTNAVMEAVAAKADRERTVYAWRFAEGYPWAPEGGLLLVPEAPKTGNATAMWRGAMPGPREAGYVLSYFDFADGWTLWAYGEGGEVTEILGTDFIDEPNPATLELGGYELTREDYGHIPVVYADDLAAATNKVLDAANDYTDQAANNALAIVAAKASAIEGNATRAATAAAASAATNIATSVAAERAPPAAAIAATNTVYDMLTASPMVVNLSAYGDDEYADVYLRPGVMTPVVFEADDDSRTNLTGGVNMRSATGLRNYSVFIETMPTNVIGNVFGMMFDPLFPSNRVYATPALYSVTNGQNGFIVQFEHGWLMTEADMPCVIDVKETLPGVIVVRRTFLGEEADRPNTVWPSGLGGGEGANGPSGLGNGRYPMFVFDMNPDGSNAWRHIELKASTNNFETGTRPLFWCASTTNGDAAYDSTGNTNDWCRLFTTGRLLDWDGRRWTAISNTMFMSNTYFTPRTLAVIVDPDMLRRELGSEWLVEGNDELVWSYLRVGRYDNEKDGMRYEAWRMAYPVKWFNELPSWATQTPVGTFANW